MDILQNLSTQIKFVAGFEGLAALSCCTSFTVGWTRGLSVSADANTEFSSTDAQQIVSLRSTVTNNFEKPNYFSGCENICVAED